jgi:hypothetical protein
MYFDNCRSKEEVQSKYNRLAKCVSGDMDIVQEIQREYKLRIDAPPVAGIEQRIDQVLAWAANQPGFDVTFLTSLKEQFARSGNLSPKQQQAFENIVRKTKLKI